MRHNYRLALDVGSNSIGYALLSLTGDGPKAKVTGILHAGVRTFSNGREEKSGSPLAERRRMKRQGRVQLSRRKQRLFNCCKVLVKHGLLPKDPTERCLSYNNPYELRARGVHERLELFDFGRALYALCKRRGPRLSRGLEQEDKEEKGLREKSKKLTHVLKAEGKTYGEYLYKRLQDNSGLRGRSIRYRPGVLDEVDIYPNRKLIEAEFRALWDTQSKHHPTLTEEARDGIEEVIFFQRKLKPVNPGFCTFLEGELRCLKALPIAQEFRIRSEVQNLRIYDERHVARELTPEQRDELIRRLMGDMHLTFKTDIASVLKLKGGTINLESEIRDRLLGDVTTTLLSDEKGFGAQWFTFSEERREEIVTKLQTETDEEDLLAWLRGLGLIEDQVQYMFNIKLPVGYTQLSRKATLKILDHLRGGQDYVAACKSAGFHHSDFSGDIIHQVGTPLPLYNQLRAFARLVGLPKPNCKYGDITNPTAHIVLNQSRILYNDILRKYGVPQSVTIETTRDLKNSFKSRKRLEKAQKKGNDQRKRFEELFPSMAYSHRNRILFRLWEELPEGKKECVYSGSPITLENLFNDRNCQVDHIIPRSVSFDDNIDNLVLCTRMTNQAKGQRTPAETFGSRDFEKIMQRVEAFASESPGWEAKKKRFVEGYVNENGFKARQLNDTAYASRLVQLYLQHGVKDPQAVWGVPGSVTAELRHKLGFDLGGVAEDKSTLWRICSLGETLNIAPHWQAGKSHDIRKPLSIGRLIKLIKKGEVELVRVEPLGFVNSVRHYGPLARPGHHNGELVRVSHSPKKDDTEVQVRRSIESLSLNQLGSIKGLGLRASIQAYLEKNYPHYKEDSKALKKGLRDFIKQTGTRRALVLEKVRNLVHLKNGTYQAEDIHHQDIVQLADGKIEAVTCRYPELPAHNCEPPAGKLLMRLFQGDYLRFKEPIPVKVVKSEPGKGKLRNDHRHHTLDAIVVGLVNRPLLLAAKCGRAEDMLPLLLNGEIEQFKTTIESSLRSVKVSLRPEHGAGGKIFNETCYGTARMKKS